MEQFILNELVFFYLNPIIQYRDSLYGRLDKHCTFLIYNCVSLPYISECTFFFSHAAVTIPKRDGSEIVYMLRGVIFFPTVDLS